LAPPSKVMGADLVDIVKARTSDYRVAYYTIYSKPTDLQCRFVLEQEHCFNEWTLLIAGCVPQGLDNTKVPPEGDKL
jgi:hypothetical protein